MATHHPPLTSIRDYPSRGPWGDNHYRGNCTGWLIVDLLRLYNPVAFLDPSIGGGTSKDVCLNLKKDDVDVIEHLRQFEFTVDGSRRIREPYSLPIFRGYDLRFGSEQNLFNKPWGDKKFDLVFWHPPYGTMIQYSPGPKGITLEEVGGDISRLRLEQFRDAMCDAARILFDDAVAPGGRLVILIGTHRDGGIERRFDLDLSDELGRPGFTWIKTQHNYASMGFRYPDVNFAYITHEYVLHWLKRNDGIWDRQCISSQFLRVRR